MLTVKVHSTTPNGSTIKKLSISALQVEADYYEDGMQYVEVKDYRGDFHTFDIEDGVKIFVENFSGKTVDVYRVYESTDSSYK